MNGKLCHTYSLLCVLLGLLAATTALAGNRRYISTDHELTGASLPKKPRLRRMGEESLNDGFPIRQIARALPSSAFAVVADYLKGKPSRGSIQRALRSDVKQLLVLGRRLDGAANQVLTAVAPSIGNIKKHFHVVVNNLPLLTSPSQSPSLPSSATTSVADHESRRRMRLVAGFLHPTRGIEPDLVLLRLALLGRSTGGRTSIAEEYSDSLHRDQEVANWKPAHRLRQNMLGLLTYLFRLQDQAFAVWFLAGTTPGYQPENATQEEADQQFTRLIEKKRGDSLEEEFRFLESIFKPCDYRLLIGGDDNIHEQQTTFAVNCTNGEFKDFGTVCYELCLLEAKGQRCRAWRCFLEGRWRPLSLSDGGAEGGNSSAAGSGRAWVLPFAFFVCFMLLIGYVIYGLRQPESQNSAPYDPD